MGDRAGVGVLLVIRNLSSACVVLALSAACAALAGPEPGSAPKGPDIRLNCTAGAKATFGVVGLDPAVLADLARAKLDSGQWADLFAVYVDDGGAKGKDQPPVLGSYRVEDGVLRFKPRFPPAAGLRYRAVFDPARLPKPANPMAEKVVAEFTIPKPAAAPTVVEDL